MVKELYSRVTNICYGHRPGRALAQTQVLTAPHLNTIVANLGSFQYVLDGGGVGPEAEKQLRLVESRGGVVDCLNRKDTVGLLDQRQ